jgi:hypothetical protein
MVVVGVIVPILLCSGTQLFFRQVGVLTIEMPPQVRHQVET